MIDMVTQMNQHRTIKMYHPTFSLSLSLSPPLSPPLCLSVSVSLSLSLVHTRNGELAVVGGWEFRKKEERERERLYIPSYKGQ